MNLCDRIRMAAFLIRIAGIAAILSVGFCTKAFAIAVAATLVWLPASGPLLRQRILPGLFPSTVCAGCLRFVPLIARWKCGDHFTDHRERHILTFHCNQGHLLEGFNCPRCKATILVQRGDRQRLRHGSAVRLRTVSRLPAQGILIGHDRHGRDVRIPWNVLAWHMAILGGTGRGKSTLLANFISQLITLRIGFTILDCGDLAPSIRRLVPPAQQADLIYLDAAATANPFALNILSADSPLEQAMLVEELIELFHRMYGSSWGPLLEHQLRMALRAVISANGSLRDVYEMFVSANHRLRILRRVTDPAAKSFWMNEFPTIPATRRSAVVNKLAPIVFHPILGPIIGARDCVVNADEVIANHRMVVVSLWTGSPADDVTSVLGTFLVQKIVAAAFRQGAMQQAERVPHVLIVDEFVRFIHRASSFEQILSEARRYRLSLVVSSQYAEQLTPAIRAAIFGNIGALATFRVGHRDARILTDEFSGSDIGDFTELDVGRCLMRVGNDWNQVRTLPPPRLGPVQHSRVAPAQPSPALPHDNNRNDTESPDEDEDFVR